MASDPWTTLDDALLCRAVESGVSLPALAMGVVSFSQPFNEEQITQRWRSLLYDPRVAHPAAVAMAALPEVTFLLCKYFNIIKF